MSYCVYKTSLSTEGCFTFVTYINGIISPFLTFFFFLSHTYTFILPMIQHQSQEKWSSVRITESKKSSMKVENHISVHSNLNLNGLITQEHKGLGKEV